MPYRDFFMSLAYITGGQYVPMVNAQLLAKVIIGGVREEISLDRLMQDAQADIDREMQRAETEGVDEKEKIKRINTLFSSKNLRSHQMQNTYGAPSAVATDCYSKCADMSEMQMQFASKAPTHPTGSLFGSVPTAAFGGPPMAYPTSSVFGGAPTTTSTGFFSAGTPAVPTSGFTFGAPMAPMTSSAVVMPTADTSYELEENAAINEDQAARVYQKWQHRKK